MRHSSGAGAAGISFLVADSPDDSDAGLPDDSDPGPAVTPASSIAPDSSTGSPGIVISQLYGAGGNSGAVLNADFIELFNRGTAPVDVTGWSLQYASASGSSWQKTILKGVIQPGQYYLVPESTGTNGAALPAGDVTGGGSFNMSASSGKVALVSSSASLPANTCPTGATVVDFVGYGTSANCAETTSTPNIGATTALLRAKGGCGDTDNNGADFQVAAPKPRNSASPVQFCTGPTPPSGVGGANPATVEVNSTVLLTVIVTAGQFPTSTGLGVAGDLSAIGGSATQPFYDDGTNGDAVAGDNVFSFAATVSSGTRLGVQILTATVTDAQQRKSTASLAFTVTPPPPPLLAIHTLQGSGDRSPYAGQSASARGIVTAVRSNGFFLQARDTEVDADPATSEGIFVFTGSPVPSAAAVGNEVQVSGPVVEFQPSFSTLTITEFSGGISVKLIGTGNALPAPVTLTIADVDPAGALDQLERYEGMRVRADSLTTVSGTGGFLDEKNAIMNSDGTCYAVLTGLPRPSREPGLQVGNALWPLVPASTPAFDGNPERLRVDTHTQVGATRIDVTSNTLLSNVVGVLDYGSDAYTIDTDPGAPPIVTGGMTSVPVRAAGDREFTIAAFNMQHFFNATVDDPGATLLTPAAYDVRLTKASLVIRNILRLPDILGLEEVENLATLQDLASRVNSDAVAAGLPDPGYQGYTEQGNDIGGIDVAILVKGGRVRVDSVTQIGKDTTFTDPRDGSPSLLNDRPPLVLAGALIPPKGQPFPVTFVVVHQRSLINNDVNNPLGLYARAKRLAQAEFLAQLIAQHQAAGENVVSVGDYNAYPFNDGLVDVIGTVIGAPVPAGSVLVPSPDLVDPDLVDLINTLPADNRYTYVESGNTQSLDHVIVSGSLLARPYELEVAHNNADFPRAFYGDPGRPERSSDHDIPVAFFTFPPPQADLVVSTSGSTTLVSGQPSSYTVTVSNLGPDTADSVTLSATLPAGVAASVSARANWSCANDTGAVTCTSAALAPGTSARFTVFVTPACATANGTSQVSRLSVTSQTLDSNPTNNTTEQAWIVSNPPPSIVGIAADKSRLWPPNHKLVDVVLSYSVTDNCDNNIVPAVTVSSSEAANSPGSGNTSPDWNVLSNTHVQLRAERSGSDTNGRVYTVTVTATDSAGGSSSQAVQVVVPHNP